MWKWVRWRVVVAMMVSHSSVTPRTARHDRARNRSGQRWTAIAPRRCRLELCRHAQQQILAPERRDELDADRQADGRLAGDAERCREAPDAFEPRQDREWVGRWRQEFVEKGGWLAGGGRE